MKPDHFFVRARGLYQKVPLDEILYLETDGSQVQLVLEKKTILIRGTLDTVLRMLPIQSFCRIHESYAVAVNKIISFDNESVFTRIGKKTMELPMGKYHKQLLEKKIWLLGDKIEKQTGKK